MIQPKTQKMWKLKSQNMFFLKQGMHGTTRESTNCINQASKQKQRHYQAKVCVLQRTEPFSAAKLLQAPLEFSKKNLQAA